MAGPFRSDEDVRRERSGEVAEQIADLEKRVAAARKTRNGLRGRANPILWSILSPWSIPLLLAGLAVGAWLEVGVDARWMEWKCQVDR